MLCASSSHHPFSESIEKTLHLPSQPGMAKGLYSDTINLLWVWTNLETWVILIDWTGGWTLWQNILTQVGNVKCNCWLTCYLLRGKQAPWSRASSCLTINQLILMTVQIWVELKWQTSENSIQSAACLRQTQHDSNCRHLSNLRISVDLLIVGYL